MASDRMTPAETLGRRHRDFQLIRAYALSWDDVVALAARGVEPPDLVAACRRMARTRYCHVCHMKRLDVDHRDALALAMCPRCYDEGCLENEHNDYGHDTPVEGCPVCHPPCPACGRLHEPDDCPLQSQPAPSPADQYRSTFGMWGV
jgi:hypothetical protein